MRYRHTSGREVGAADGSLLADTLKASPDWEPLARKTKSKETSDGTRGHSGRRAAARKAADD